MTMPMGLALSTRFRATCATFHALEAIATIFEAAAWASVAILTAFKPVTTVSKPVRSCVRLVIASPVLASSSM